MNLWLNHVPLFRTALFLFFKQTFGHIPATVTEANLCFNFHSDLDQVHFYAPIKSITFEMRHFSCASKQQSVVDREDLLRKSHLTITNHFLGVSPAKSGPTLAGSDTGHAAPLRAKVEHVAVVEVNRSSNLFCPEKACKSVPEVEVCIKTSI